MENEGSIQIDPSAVIKKLLQKKEEAEHRIVLLECLVEDQQRQITELVEQLDNIAQRTEGGSEETTPTSGKG